jgi:hypothetical protein
MCSGCTVRRKPSRSPWDQLTGEEMVERFWYGLIGGIYFRDVIAIEP